MDMSTLSAILTVIAGIFAVFGGIYWGKFHKLLKEGAEAVLALATFIGDLKTALKPDEDGKVRITEEEALVLKTSAEKLYKEFKDVVNVFKRGVTA